MTACDEMYHAHTSKPWGYRSYKALTQKLTMYIRVTSQKDVCNTSAFTQIVKKASFWKEFRTFISFHIFILNIFVYIKP